MESVITIRCCTTQGNKRRRRPRENDISKLFVKSPLAAPVRRHHQKDHEDNTRDEADSSPLSPRVHHLEPLSRPRTAFPSTSFPTTNQPSKQSIRPLTGAGGFSRLGSKPKPQQQFDCVAKIQRLVGGLQWQVNEILDEILPEQQALMKATRLALFRPVSSQSECSSDLRLVIESHSNIILKTSELEQFKRHHRISHKAQNQPCINNIRQDTERSHLSFHEKETELKDHVLALWEHKYQANELNLKDSLYLLIHRNLMDILEHAALKRVWCRSIEETNIESKRILYNLDTLLHLQITLAEIQKVNKKKTLYQLLCQNLWQTIDQKYFHVTISTCCQIQKQQKKINIKTSKKTTTDIWIRENCLKEIFIHRHKLQNFEKQKQFASQNMLKFFYTKIHQFYKKRFFQWKKIFFFLKTCQQVKTFCQLKSILYVYKFVRVFFFQKKIIGCFHKWLFLLKEQRLLEQEAAIICIQSVWRSKNTRKKHFLSQLNLKIAKFQAIWKSFQTRRFLRRQKRYQKILFVTIQIQIQWRFRQRHRFFVYQFQLNRASKIITKSIRQYVSKCQMLKQAMVHLTRSHAATLIQMWMRRCFVSKRCHQRLCIRQIKAQRILRRFFCRIQLFKLFEKRFLMMLKKKTEKAIKIQALYRIRKAKIRFNLLKDQLEAHKKQEMIRLLWQNTYATRIQTWWKRNSNRNRRLLLDTLNQ